MATKKSRTSSWSGAGSASLVPVLISGLLAMGSEQAQALDQLSSQSAGVMASEIRPQVDDRIEIQASKKHDEAKKRETKDPSAMPPVSPPRPAVDHAQRSTSAPASPAPARTRLPEQRQITISLPTKHTLPRARDARLLDIRNPAANPQFEMDLGNFWADANDGGVIRAIGERVEEQGERLREALADIVALF